MRTLLMGLTRLGDWLMSLSDQTKKTIVLSAYALLIGGSIYKLIVSINRLNDPQSMATPARLVEPMSRLYLQSSETMDVNEQVRLKKKNELDSLLKIPFPHKPKLR